MSRLPSVSGGGGEKETMWEGALETKLELKSERQEQG